MKSNNETYVGVGLGDRGGGTAALSQGGEQLFTQQGGTKKFRQGGGYRGEQEKNFLKFLKTAKKKLQVNIEFFCRLWRPGGGNRTT